MRLFALIWVALLPLGAQDSGTADRYPEIRVLLREAEAAAANSPPLNGRQPSAWAASLYARAGYLDDAARVIGKRSGLYLWRARVLYGDLAGAEQSLASIADPEGKAGAMFSLADLLWKMGEPEKARIRFEAARQIAPKISNPEHRKRMQASIEQGLVYLSEEPPYRLSATPKPRKKIDVQDSLIPLFPITADGFRNLDLRDTNNRAVADAEFLNKLYDRMGAGDREGLVRIAGSAATPFQSALAMASIEHVLILASEPEMAEQYAEKIPEANSDCLLAKAEAVSAAGAAWLRAGNTSRASKDFETAAGLVESVPDLQLGKVSVIVSIAAAQFKGGMVASSGTSFRLAIELAQELPPHPGTLRGQAGRPSPRIHYRDEAFHKILPAAIRARNLGVAHEVAELWRLADGKADADIVRAWLDANQTDEALAFARKIVDPAERVTVLLVIAEELLNKAGAPDL